MSFTHAWKGPEVAKFDLALTSCVKDVPDGYDSDDLEIYGFKRGADLVVRFLISPPRAIFCSLAQFVNYSLISRRTQHKNSGSAT